MLSGLPFLTNSKTSLDVDILFPLIFVMTSPDLSPALFKITLNQYGIQDNILALGDGDACLKLKKMDLKRDLHCPFIIPVPSTSKTPLQDFSLKSLETNAINYLK